MNATATGLIGILILVAVFFGWQATRDSSQLETTIEQSDDAMMEQDESAMMSEDNSDAMKKKDDAMTDGSMMKAGSYETYSAEKLSLANDGKIILFFRASWCPTCRSLDADIKSNLGAIPEGVTILDVDYDKEAVLKQKHGVTYQHTMVQVDSSGNQIAKWSGSPTLVSLIGNVK